MNTEQLDTAAKLIQRLASLNVSANFLGVTEGPVVSVYRFEPTGSTRVSHLEALAADFAVATSSQAVLVKRMPSEAAVGVFVPNLIRKGVNFREVVSELFMEEHKDKKIPLALGIDHLGNFVVEDLTEMPHLLIAGSTGSGKSTLLNSLIAAIIYKVNDSSVKLVISDTKGVEFQHFADAPHLLFPPATTVYETCERMEWLCSETDRRMKILAKYGDRNIHELRGHTGFAADISKPTVMTRQELRERCGEMPFIVLVIDEIADLLTNTAKNPDTKISVSKLAASQLQRIVARSRAAGIYVIAATQRPSVDVVGGVIKANFPARISFRLPSQADSRTVLNTGGAEHLLSQGDCLFISPNKPGLQRIHAPLASLEDVKACAEFSACRTR